jgi:hypothetical protein
MSFFWLVRSSCTVRCIERSCHPQRTVRRTVTTWGLISRCTTSRRRRTRSPSSLTYPCGTSTVPKSPGSPSSILKLQGALAVVCCPCCESHLVHCTHSRILRVSPPQRCCQFTAGDDCTRWPLASVAVSQHLHWVYVGVCTVCLWLCVLISRSVTTVLRGPLQLSRHRVVFRRHYERPGRL